MTKLYAQEKRVFDIDKVTVVGSPTITSDGIASGFSGSNYIKKDGILPTSGIHDYIFKLRYKHITNDFDTTGYMFNVATTGGFYFGAVARLSPKTISFVESISGSAYFVNTVSLVEGQTYDIEMQTDFSTYARYYIDGELKGSVTYAKSHSPTTGNVIIGTQAPNSLPLTMGELDLKQFSITVDGELVYSPTKPAYALERRKEGFDLSKFTIVGTPTITEYGVASGFSGSNYLKTGVTIGQNPFKIICKCSTPNSGTGVLVDNISGNGWYPLLLQANNTITVYAKDANGNSVYTGGSITIPYNQQFLVSFEFTGNKYILGLSIDDGTTWTYKESENANHIANIDKELIIGRYGAFAQNGWLGSIDLAQLSITVDGKEVFTGAKEKFYAMRRM